MRLWVGIVGHFTGSPRYTETAYIVMADSEPEALSKLEAYLEAHDDDGLVGEMHEQPGDVIHVGQSVVREFERPED